MQQSIAQRRASSRPAVAVFFVMILLVLLSACANLGNMLLARGLVRRREIDIRMAIGASRARVLRQLMTENFLLALLGAAAGLGFGAVAVRLLLNAIGAPYTVRLTIGWPILIAALRTDDGVRHCFRSAVGSANGPHQSAQEYTCGKAW